MKKLFICFVSLILMAVFTACKKTKTSAKNDCIGETPAVFYPDYAMLKKGNYWIYGLFKVEQNGQITDLKQIDSCYIDKDTLIRNRTFYKVHKRDFVYNKDLVYFAGDSLHYVINSYGTILFSSEDFSSIFYASAYIEGLQDSINPKDTIYTIKRKMADKDFEIRVPAGTFVTSNMQTSFLYYPNHLAPNTENPRHINSRFAKNVGEVLQTEQFNFYAPYVIERRLLLYHLN